MVLFQTWMMLQYSLSASVHLTRGWSPNRRDEGQIFLSSKDTFRQTLHTVDMVPVLLPPDIE